MIKDLVLEEIKYDDLTGDERLIADALDIDFVKKFFSVGLSGRFYLTDIRYKRNAIIRAMQKAFSRNGIVPKEWARELGCSEGYIIDLMKEAYKPKR